MASAFLFFVASLVVAEAGPLKIFVLAGQSNMEGQAEVSKINASSPDKRQDNGTLTYQLTDPRTAAEFAPCWDKSTNDWTVLPKVNIWFNEKKKSDLPADLSDGTFGPLSIGFGCGGSRAHIGPEYGFSFGMDNKSVYPDAGEDILIIKTAWGGKTLCGDFRPPSSCAGNMSKVGFYYKQMLQYVSNVMAPQNLTKLFPHLDPTGAKVVGFGWVQGWNDGCGETCTQEYETNMVNLIADLRKEWNNPEMAVSIPVSGFGGWGQKIGRRLGIIAAQFGACNATRHPGMAHCQAEETRGFWRSSQFSPVNQGYHWWHNAESYWLMGQAMASGMVKALAQ